MNLFSAALYFNHTVCFDSYSGVELFKAQMNPFEDVTRDGITAQRRVLELAPGTAIPARRTVRVADTDWIIGIREIDQFMGRTIREKYVVHQVDGAATVRTFFEELAEAAGHETLAARVWVKTEKQVDISSFAANQLTLYVSTSDIVSPWNVVTIGGEKHIVREVYTAAAGHQALTVEQLEDKGIETVVVLGEGKWDALTQSFKATREPVKGLRLRWQAAFTYFSQGSTTFARGDMQLVLPSEVAEGVELEMYDGNWKVLSSHQKGGAYVHHVRRA